MQEEFEEWVLGEEEEYGDIVIEHKNVQEDTESIYWL